MVCMFPQATIAKRGRAPPVGTRFKDDHSPAAVMIRGHGFKLKNLKNLGVMALLLVYCTRLVRHSTFLERIPKRRPGIIVETKMHSESYIDFRG